MSDPKWPDTLQLGDVFESPVEEIWNGTAYQESRRRLSSECPVESCSHCLWRKGIFVPQEHPVAHDWLNRGVRRIVRI